MTNSGKCGQDRPEKVQQNSPSTCDGDPPILTPESCPLPASPGSFPRLPSASPGDSSSPIRSRASSRHDPSPDPENTPLQDSDASTTKVLAQARADEEDGPRSPPADLRPSIRSGSNVSVDVQSFESYHDESPIGSRRSSVDNITIYSEEEERRTYHRCGILVYWIYLIALLIPPIIGAPFVNWTPGEIPFACGEKNWVYWYLIYWFYSVVVCAPIAIWTGLESIFNVFGLPVLVLALLHVCTTDWLRIIYGSVAESCATVSGGCA